MAIYNLNNTSRIGKYVRVFDANDLEWTWCLECDTETGRIQRFKTDSKNRVLIDPQTENICIEEIKTAAPLTVIDSSQCDRPKPATNDFLYEGCDCDGECLRSCPVFWKHENDRIRVTERKAMARMKLPVSHREAVG